MKKISFYAATFVLVLGVAAAGMFIKSPQVSAQVVQGTLTGWGWSDNIGWISLNCATGGSTGNNICATSNYSVSEDASGNLSGYAWSDNIGWIKFGGLSGFPNTSYGTNAKVTSSGSLTGWALALAGAGRSDGWDGWISLSGMTVDNSSAYGVNYNSTTGLFSGYSWGSDVIGWLTLNSSAGTSGGCDVTTGEVCIHPGTPPTTATVSLTINPTSVATGTPATLTWTTTNVTTCSVTSSGGDWTGSIGTATSSGTHLVGPFLTTAGSPRTYTLICNANALSGGGTVSSSAQLTITGSTSNGNPNSSMCTPVVNATLCPGEGASSTLSATTVVSQCSTPPPSVSGLCQYVCNTGFRQVGTGAGARCVLNSTIQEN